MNGEISMIVLLLIVLALVAVAPRQALAFDEWTTGEKAWLAASAAAMVIDWRQTRVIAANPREYYEHNPILGSHPSVGQVDVYIAASAAAVVLIAHVLPHGWRTAWLIGTTAVEAGCIVNNARIGIGVQW